MPKSTLRQDLPAKKPKVEDYTDGAAFERAMDDWADAEAQRKPGVFIKKWQGSRDGDDRSVHLTNFRGAEENYQLLTKKKGDDGKSNGEFQRRVEDFVGAETGDDAKAVAEGEMARVRAEEGMTFINDMVKAIDLNMRYNRGPVFQLLREEGAEVATHMARGFADSESYDAVIQICEIKHFDSDGDAIPDLTTLQELRQRLPASSGLVVPVFSEDRILL